VVRITDILPSNCAIEETAHTLARYAAICQENGLVPIVEPEILQDGSHSIERCAEVSELVFARVQQKLLEQGILLEAMLLKPNMVTSGADCEHKADHAQVAWMTVRTLSRTISGAVPGIMFLSGGSSE